MANTKGSALANWIDENEGKNPKGQPSASILQQVEMALRDKGWKGLDVNIEKGYVRLPLKGEHTDLILIVGYEEKIQLLTLISLFAAKVPDDKKAPIYEFVVRYNERLKYGQMDFDDQGNVAHKTYLFLESENLKRDRFDAILENNLRTADGYFPALMSIIFGGKSAAQAIDDIFKG